MSKLLWQIRWPLGLAVANFFVWPLAAVALGLGIGPLVAFNVCRVVLMGLAGWLVVRSGIGGLGKAVLAATAIFVVDHVVLKGGQFLVLHAIDPAILDRKGLMAFSGVLVSFVMLVPVAMLLGVLGGTVARITEKKAATQPARATNAAVEGEGDVDGNE